MAVGDRMRSLVLRVIFVVLRRGFRELQPQPTDAAIAEVPGPNPIRVLVVGAGVAVGYGVRSNALALGGQLVTTLAEASGRGGRVDTRARASLPMKRVSAFLGGAGVAGYDAVVCVPGFAEAANGVDPARSMKELRQLIRDLQATGDPDLTIVLTGLPLPVGPDWAERTARDHSVRLNAAVAAVAAESVRLRYVEMPDPPHLQDHRRFDPPYYRRCAELITASLLGSSAP